MQRLNRLGRCFKGKPQVVQPFETPLSRYRQCVKIMVDSDHAGDLNTKSSLVGLRSAKQTRQSTGSMVSYQVLFVHWLHVNSQVLSNTARPKKDDQHVEKDRQKVDNTEGSTESLCVLCHRDRVDSNITANCFPICRGRT